MAYIENPQNVYGDALVSGNAVVTGNAVVYGGAVVSGDAVVYGDAVVSGDAGVSGYARVSGNALIKKTSDYLVVGPAKSSGRFTTAHIDSKIGVRINCGCFSGPINEFINAIEETHKDNPEYLKQYRAFVTLITSNFNLE